MISLFRSLKQSWNIWLLKRISLCNTRLKYLLKKSDFFSYKNIYVPGTDPLTLALALYLHVHIVKESGSLGEHVAGCQPMLRVCFYKFKNNDIWTN